MSTIKYGIYAEDMPFKIFLETILPSVVSKIGMGINIDLDKKFSNDKKPQNGIGHFKKTFNIAVTQGCLAESDNGYGLRFCILGLDCDENELSKLQDELSEKLSESNQSDLAVLCIARKSIEFWMWYCEPNNQGLLLDYESHTNTTMKLQLYGRERGGRRGKERALELAQKADIDYLCKKSVSFNIFYEDFKCFAKKLVQH